MLFPCRSWYYLMMRISLFPRCSWKINLIIIQLPVPLQSEFMLCCKRRWIYGLNKEDTKYFSVESHFSFSVDCRKASGGLCRMARRLRGTSLLSLPTASPLSENLAHAPTKGLRIRASKRNSPFPKTVGIGHCWAGHGLKLSWWFHLKYPASCNEPTKVFPTLHSLIPLHALSLPLEQGEARARGGAACSFPGW